MDGMDWRSNKACAMAGYQWIEYINLSLTKNCLIILYFFWIKSTTVVSTGCIRWEAFPNVMEGGCQPLIHLHFD